MNIQPKKQNSKLKTEKILTLLHDYKWVRDFITFIVFKFEEFMFLGGNFADFLIEDGEYTNGIPILKDLNKIRTWIKLPLSQQQPILLNIIYYFMISQIEGSKSFLTKIDSNKFPTYFLIKNRIDAKIDNFRTIPSIPSIYASLTSDFPDEFQKFNDLFEESLNKSSIEEIENLWNSFKLPITIICRANLFKFRNLNKFLYLSPFDAIEHLLKDKMREKSKIRNKNKENNSEKLSLIKIINPPKKDLLSLEQNLQKLNNLCFDSTIKSEFGSFYQNLNDEEKTVILKGLYLNNITFALTQILIEISSEEFVNENPDFVFFSQEQEKNGEKKPEDDTFCFMSNDEIQDIIEDFLWRFNGWIEKYLKKILIILDPSISNLNTYPTLGRVFKSHDVFIIEEWKKLWNLRNAIAHHQYEIIINSDDMDEIYIQFPKKDSNLPYKEKWDDIKNFLFKFYYIFLAFLRKTQDILIKNDRITEKIWIDSISSEFKAECSNYWEKFLNMLENFDKKLKKDILPKLEDKESLEYQFVMAIINPLKERFFQDDIDNQKNKGKENENGI